MKTICLDPVTPPLLIAGHLSFVTVDRPPPVGWIGQRVAIYADRTLDLWQPAVDWWNDQPDATHNTLALGLYEDAIVGSGTLAEARFIRRAGDRLDSPRMAHISRYGDEQLLSCEWDDEWKITDISDQLPLQDWSPGRWALRFTDVAPTSKRCPWKCVPQAIIDTPGLVWHDGPGTPCWVRCSVCDGKRLCPPVVAPVLSGEGTYREWTPT